MLSKARYESILNTFFRFSLVTLLTLSLLVVAVSQVAALRVENPGPELNSVLPVVQGTDIHYNGTGFTPGGTVVVSIDSGYPALVYPGVDIRTADLTGFVIGQFEAGNNIRPGTRQLTAVDNSTLETATASVIVLAPVQFFTNPQTFLGAVPGNISSTACGGLVGNHTSFICGPNFDAAAVLPNPATGWSFNHWEATGNTTYEPPGYGWGISCQPLNTTSTNCTGFSAGALKAVFSAAITIITDPTYVGSVSFGSCAMPHYTNGSVSWRPELLPEFTSLPVCANPAYGFTFIDWTATGGISVANNLSPTTTLQLTGPGTLTAHYEVQISLQAGWNLMSLPLIPSDSLISNLLKPLLSKNEVVSVWTYTNTRAWQFYLPGKSSTLTTMVDGNGYWIYMTSADKLNMTGAVLPNSHIPPTYSLVTGWNLIGFKPQPVITNDTVSQYLGSISGKYDPNNVWVYDSLSTNWIRADPSFVLHPGQAVWILMISPASLKP